MAARPNILLITSDQHRPDCFGHIGKRAIQTPHLDALAERATRFSCAITPNVLCQPARASILTGMLPLTHGVYDNQVHLDVNIGQRGWPAKLSDVGYHCGFIGKAHFGEDPAASEWGAPESREDSANFPEDWSGPFMGFDYAELMILGHWHDLLPCEQPPHGQHFERWFWSHPEAWKLWAEDSKTGQSANYGTVASQTWSSALPAEWHSTTWVTERTCEFLQKQKTVDKPFCLWASYPDPHHPFDCPEPWASRHKAADVDISRSHKLDLNNVPWWFEAALTRKPQGKSEKHRILREEYSRMPPQTDAQLAEMTANYYNMIAFIDDGVGKILSELEKTGQAENTIVIFTSDHGELLGDHGLYLKGPMIYDNLLRVGMLAAGPGIEAGKIIDDPVSTLDLAATFCDWAGTETDTDAQSVSLVPLLDGTGEREFAYNEWKLGPARVGVELNLRTIRTRVARLTVDITSGAGELYNLEDDPDELHNLWDKPEEHQRQQSMLAMIDQRPGPIMAKLPEHTE